MLYLTTKNVLYSSHQLKNHKGKCGVLHGHQYEIELTIKAPYSQINNNKCNFLIDLYDFDKIWKKLFPIDHVNINEITHEDNPSIEFLAKWIYDNLKESLVDLYSVKIYETPTNYCTYIEDEG
ncbi:6-carboxytetrahydropterin synthase [uncultured Methanobrevibacter sp.]|uniref:6-pyruvoyl trahydropterin synthase family protein n=1 Tax=uncultured Methanobrevibacter sp. TaxID=253161 RepID=UPI0026153D99|nr:6-carboxytetrahydropterin synthase [uncultured Methanobrevibacter sp.]